MPFAPQNLQPFPALLKKKTDGDDGGRGPDEDEEEEEVLLLLLLLSVVPLSYRRARVLFYSRARTEKECEGSLQNRIEDRGAFSVFRVYFICDESVFGKEEDVRRKRSALNWRW